MIRHSSIFSLTAALVMGVLVSATLADTDFCLWCNQAMSLNFMSCVCSKIKNNPIFGKISSAALDDMKNSMTATALAITQIRKSVKMKIIAVAMAGVFAEFIKSLPLNGNSEQAVSALLEIVGDCYATTTGQSQNSFTQDVGKTVDFMLNKEERLSYEDSVSRTNSALPQYPEQASASSAALGRQNDMPPNNYYAPPLQPSFTLPVQNNFVPNQIYTPPSPKFFPYYSNTGLPESVQLAGQNRANVASLIYPLNKQDNAPYIRPGPNVQQQNTEANAAGNSYSSQPNQWSNFAPATTVQQNKAASSSTFFGVNNLSVRPGQFLPQNKELVGNTAPSYANNDQRNLPNFVNEPVNNAAFHYVNNNQTNLSNDQRDQPNFITVRAVQQQSSAATSGTKDFTLNYQSLGDNPSNTQQNQFLSQNKGPVSNAAPSNGNNNQMYLPNFTTNKGGQQPSSAATSGDEASALKNQRFPPYYSQNQIVHDSEGEILRQNGAYPLNHFNNSLIQLVQSTTGASFYNKTKSNYDYNSNYPPRSSSYDNQQPYYDYGSKYPSQLSSNNTAPPNYDISDSLQPIISPDTAPREDESRSQPTNGKLVEVTNENNIPQSGDGSKYSYNNSDNLKPVIPPGTVSREDDLRSQPTNGETVEVTNENNISQRGDEDYVARAMKFAETIYVKCAKSRKFKSTFNERTSNNKAASCIYNMLQGSLKHCGYSKYAVEIANACSDGIKHLPEKSTFAAYGEAVSISLMEEFYTKKMIGENPEDQARCIIDDFLSRLKKRKSSRSSKSATSTAQFSYSTVTPYAESSSSPDYSMITDYGQHNSDFSEMLYYYNSPAASEVTMQPWLVTSTTNPGGRGGNRYTKYDGSFSDQDSGYRNYYYSYSTLKPDQKINDYYYDDYDDDFSHHRTFRGRKKKPPGKTDSPTTYYHYYNDYSTLQTTDLPNHNSNLQYGSYSTSNPDGLNNQDLQILRQYYRDYYFDTIQKLEKSEDDYHYQYNGDNPTSQRNKRLKNHQYHYDYPTVLTKTEQNRRPPEEIENLAQNARPNYNEIPRSNKINNHDSNKRQKNISVASASASSSSATNQHRKDKAKNKKPKARNRAKDRSVPNVSNFGSSKAEENQGNSEMDKQQYTSSATYDIKSIQQQQGQFSDSPSDSGRFYPNAVLASSQSQTDADNEKIEKQNRVNILMEWALSSISNGKFNYKIYSNVISALAKFLQNTHPEWESQKCLIEILIESLTACTHLLAEVPPEYLNKIKTPENIDAAVASSSTSSSEQGGQDSKQTNDINEAQSGQSYEAAQNPPQQSNSPMESSRQRDQDLKQAYQRNDAQNGQSYDGQQISQQQSNWNSMFPTQQGT